MMTVDDLRVVMGDLATSTKRYIAEEITSVLEGVGEQLAALEAKLAAVQLTPGPKGDPGRDADAQEVAAIVKAVLDGTAPPILAMRDEIYATVRKELAALPPPQHGRDGMPGRDAVVDLDALAVKAAALVPTPRDGRDAAAVDLDWLHKSLSATLVHGRDGRDGADGAPGEKGADGAPGRDGASVTLDDLRPLVLELVQAAWSALPPPRDGRDGAPGEKGLDGRDGAAGKDGRDGAPGVQGPMGEKGMDGKDGINGTNGADGLRGKDGSQFEGFDLVFDDEAGLRVRVKQGEEIVDYPMPALWDAGVWRSKAYLRGAAVSWNGSLWIAQRNTTTEKPADGSGAWRLAVKAGRDAKPPRE